MTPKGVIFIFLFFLSFLGVITGLASSGGQSGSLRMTIIQQAMLAKLELGRKPDQFQAVPVFVGHCRQCLDQVLKPSIS